MDTDLCQPEALGLSCYGCCCLDFGPPRTMLEDIRLNTLRVPRNPELIARLKRSKATHLTSGICQFVVELPGGHRVGCGIHPALFEGVDRREGYCTPGYRCRTWRDLARLTPEQQRRFIAFVKTQGLDDYDYSLGIVSGILMEEFEAKLGQREMEVVSDWEDVETE